MQENLTNSFCSYNIEEQTALNDLHLWLGVHTNLCEKYIHQQNEHIRKELEEKLTSSLIQGKVLLECLNNQIRNQQKTLIPASGINRFNRPKDLLNSKEIFNKNNYSFKAELGTATSNLKSIPMPSRTYLKKKKNNS